MQFQSSVRRQNRQLAVRLGRTGVLGTTGTMAGAVVTGGELADSSFLSWAWASPWAAVPQGPVAGQPRKGRPGSNSVPLQCLRL